MRRSKSLKRQTCNLRDGKLFGCARSQKSSPHQIASGFAELQTEIGFCLQEDSVTVGPHLWRSCDPAGARRDCEGPCLVNTSQQMGSTSVYSWRLHFSFSLLFCSSIPPYVFTGWHKTWEGESKTQMLLFWEILNNSSLTVGCRCHPDSLSSLTSLMLLCKQSNPHSNSSTSGYEKSGNGGDHYFTRAVRR